MQDENTPKNKKNLTPVIMVIKEKCVNCHRCISVCPVKMCNNGAGDVIEFNSDLCIGCGECIRACDHKARKGLDDFDRFMTDVKSGVPMVAIVAPSIAASFDGEYLKINGFLKSLGIKAVFDVSFGAELTVKSYLNYMEKAHPITTISQPCPTLVSFLEMYRPDLLRYLAPADSPMMHTMKMIKRFYPEYAKCKIAVISPCLSKRREFDEVGIGDYNVTFVSLEHYFADNKKKIQDYPNAPYDNPPAERAVLFSSPGGLMRTVERYDPDITNHTRKIEGAPEVYHYLAHLGDAIKNGRAPIYELVDCLNCKMGCNGGPGTSNSGKHIDEVESAIEKRNREVRALYKTTSRSKIGRFFGRKKLERLIDQYWDESLYSRSYTNRSEVFRKYVKHPSKEDILDLYQKMYKSDKTDVLNCGSCGYNSCEQMAVAIYNGLNKPENCRHFIEVERHILADEHKKSLNSAIGGVYEHTLGEMTKSFSAIETLTAHINETASQVFSSSAAIEKMVQNISDIQKTLEHNATTVGKLSASSEEGKTRLSEIGALIADVSTQSDTLIGTSKVIGDISQETSILGMNAAIEAAHAGDAVGSGFAVVAGEIRKLAETSSKQASEIGRSLKDIKTLIDSSSHSSSRAQEQFDLIMSLVNAVRDDEDRIKYAIETESANGRDVIAMLNEINRYIAKIKDEADALQETGRVVVEEISRLKGSV